MPLAVPDRGDLVWIQFDPTVGHEQGGHRPAFVISPRNYNLLSGLVLLCPVTSKAKGYPFEVALPPGLPVAGVVMADQIRSMDWRARGVRIAATLPRTVAANIIAKAVTLLV